MKKELVSFPNRFDKLGMKTDQPSLPWVGLAQLRLYKHLNEADLEDGDTKKMPLLLGITPGVEAYDLDGSKRHKMMTDHTVFFSMS